VVPSICKLTLGVLGSRYVVQLRAATLGKWGPPQGHESENRVHPPGRPEDSSPHHVVPVSLSAGVPVHRPFDGKTWQSVVVQRPFAGETCQSTASIQQRRQPRTTSNRPQAESRHVDRSRQGGEGSRQDARVPPNSGPIRRGNGREPLTRRA